MTQSCKDECCAGLADAMDARLFKALCDPSRLAILGRLAERCGEMTVTQVAECCPLDLSVVSRHLAFMRDAGILDSVKRGKEVFYSIRASSLARTLRTMADVIERCCSNRKEKEA